jgi:flagellar hook-length control protein FliK
MNASPAAPVSQAPSNPRSAAHEPRSGSDAFAGLFAQFDSAARPQQGQAPQAEPAALPDAASLASNEPARAETAADESAPDPLLLAALGLAPLLPAPAPSATLPGLIGGFGIRPEAEPGAAVSPALSSPSAAANVLVAALAQAAAVLATANASASALQAAGSGQSADGAAVSTGLSLAGLSLSGLSLAGSPMTSAASSTARLGAASTAAAQRAGAGAAGLALEASALGAGSAELLEAAGAVDLDAGGLPLPASAARGAADFRAEPALALAANATRQGVAADAAAAAQSLQAAAGADRPEGQRADGSATLLNGSLKAAAGSERADFSFALRDALPPAPLAPLLASTRMDPAAPQFSGQLSQQIAWMANQKIGRAEIRLHPEELGPLEVGIELDGDEIRAEFSSRSVEVRSLLESQVPRLRELLAEQGFSLADAQIGQERAAYADSQTQREGFDRRAAGARDDTADAASPSPLVTTRARLGLIDDYA